MALSLLGMCAGMDLFVGVCLVVHQLSAHVCDQAVGKLCLFEFEQKGVGKYI